MTHIRPSKPMRESQISMMEIVMPNDANTHGNIFGGASCPSSTSREPCRRYATPATPS